MLTKEIARALYGSEDALPYLLKFMQGSGGSLPWQTFTGNPVSFNAPKAHVLKSLKASFSPIQDLHGYANPWPAGGGKNKLGWLETGSTSTVITFEKDTSVFTVGSDLTTPVGWRAGDKCKVTLEPGTYYLSSNITGQAVAEGVFVYNVSTSSILARARNEGGASFTLSEQTTVALGLNLHNPTTAGTYHFQLESGSSATSYSPYSNECPIEGWTGVDVVRAGENLLSPHLYSGIEYNQAVGTTVTLTDSTSQLTDNGDGTFSISTTQTWRYFTVVAPVKKDVTYKPLILFSSPSAVRTTWGLLDNNYTILSRISDSNNPQTKGTVFTPTVDGYYFVVFTNGGTANNTITITNPMLNLGSTASPYTPYTGETTTLTFGQTVFGGTAEVAEDGTGTGNDEWGYLTLDGTETYTNYTNVVVCRKTVSVGTGYTILSNYGDNQNIGWATNQRTNFQFAKSFFGVNDETELKSLFAGWASQGKPIQIAYPLATTVPFSVTASDTPTAVQGINTMWTDADTLTVEARAEAVNLNALQSLNMLLGGRYVNNHTPDDLTDEEALDIILNGGNR